jgi:hypothetical protein
MLRGSVRPCAFGFPSKPTWSGTATFQKYVQANCTHTGYMGLMPRSKGIASITTNFYLTPMESKFREPSVGAIRGSAIGSDTGRRSIF